MSTIKIEYSVLSEFCKAASLIKDANFIYIRYKGSVVDLFSDGNTSTAYVSLNLTSGSVSVSSSEPLSAGFSKDRFLAIFKKLYEGEVCFDFSKKTSVSVTLDNILVKIPIVSPKSNYTEPKIVSLIEDPEVVSDISSRVISCTKVDEVNNGEKKFPGVLFDNSNLLRICKFSSRSLCLSTSNSVFREPYRVVLSDEYAKAIKSFSKDVWAVGFTSRHSVLILKKGTCVYFTLMYDAYPKEYLNMWGLTSNLDLIPDNSINHSFLRNSLLNSVDFVGTALGDTEHWVCLETIGTSGDSLVWRISGKSHENVEVHEDITSGGSESVDKFSVNKRTLLMSLNMFGDDVRICNFNPSFLALSTEEGTLVSLLLKSAR